tara:strand:+ start:162 stop:764 length:603 start_codon:yes stop_codon:yes gene_type:complete
MVLLNKLKENRLNKLNKGKTTSVDIIKQNQYQLSKLVNDSNIFQDLKDIKKETIKHSNKIYFNFNDNVEAYGKNLEKRLKEDYLKKIFEKKIFIPITDIYISYKKISTREYCFYFFRISYISDKKKWCLNIKNDHDYVIDEVPLAFPNLDHFLVNGEQTFFSNYEKLIEEFYSNLMNILENKNHNFDEPFRLIRKKLVFL